MSLNIYNKIYDVFYKNDILFLSDPNDLSSSSVYTMMYMFDIFYYQKGYLWYRIKRRFDGCIIDKYKKLKKKWEPYRVYLIQLFDNDDPIQNIRTEDWFEEEEFYKYRDRGELDELIYDEFESDISLSSSSIFTSEEE